MADEQVLDADVDRALAGQAEARIEVRTERAGERVRLISDNRAYPEIERAANEVEILGRVVWKGGRL